MAARPPRQKVDYGGPLPDQGVERQQSMTVRPLPSDADGVVPASDLRRLDASRGFVADGRPVKFKALEAIKLGLDRALQTSGSLP